MRTPTSSARTPEIASPKICPRKITDAFVLPTRPSMSCGVSRWISVPAGTMTAPNANPMVNVAVRVAAM